MVDESAAPPPSAVWPDAHVVRDAEGLRALAHPLRQRLLFELVAAGHARAADLAGRTGEAANAISFHLRTLARAGLIEEAPELARDRRDRVWRPVAQTYTVDPSTIGFSAAFRPYTRVVEENLGRAVAAGGELGLKERDRSLVMVSAIATPAQVEDLANRVAALVESWADQGVAAAKEHPDEPDRQVYRLVWAAGPAAAQP